MTAWRRAWPVNRDSGNNAAIRLLLVNPGWLAVWLFNNDTAPEPGAMDALCARLAERPDAGAVRSLLVATDPTAAG